MANQPLANQPLASQPVASASSQLFGSIGNSGQPPASASTSTSSFGSTITSTMPLGSFSNSGFGSTSTSTSAFGNASTSSQPPSSASTSTSSFGSTITSTVPLGSFSNSGFGSTSTSTSPFGSTGTSAPLFAHTGPQVPLLTSTSFSGFGSSPIISFGTSTGNSFGFPGPSKSVSSFGSPLKATDTAKAAKARAKTPLNIAELRQRVFSYLDSTKDWAHCSLVAKAWAVDVRQYLWRVIGPAPYWAWREYPGENKTFKERTHLVQEVHVNQFTLGPILPRLLGAGCKKLTKISATGAYTNAIQSCLVLASMNHNLVYLSLDCADAFLSAHLLFLELSSCTQLVSLTLGRMMVNQAKGEKEIEHNRSAFCGLANIRELTLGQIIVPSEPFMLVSSIPPTPDHSLLELGRAIAFILRWCPKLECLSMEPRMASYTFEFTSIIQQCCPKLQKLQLVSGLDAAQGAILQHLPPVLKNIRLTSPAVGSLSLVQLSRYDSCLTEVTIGQQVKDPAPEYLARLFSTCSGLVEAHVHPLLSAQRFFQTNSAWVCTELRALTLGLHDGSPSPWTGFGPTQVPSSAIKDLYWSFYAKIAGLLELEYLAIPGLSPPAPVAAAPARVRLLPTTSAPASSVPIPHSISMFQSMRLGSGFELLELLKKLKVLEMGWSETMSWPDVFWISQQWPQLKELVLSNKAADSGLTYLRAKRPKVKITLV